MEWEDIVAEAKRIHWGAFLATVDRSGKPQLSFVTPGFGDERIWVATWASAAKVRNLRTNPHVALHWPVDQMVTNRHLLVRGSAMLHETDEAKQRLWAAGYFPFSLSNFYSGPDDPELVFIGIKPQSALLERAVGPAIGRWKAEEPP